MATQTASPRPVTRWIETTAQRTQRWASVPVVLVAVALGTLLIALAYAAGRSHYAWAPVPFWLGWVGSFLALALVVTSPSLSTRARLGVVLLQAAQQSMVRWMYSPLSFRFPDELQHWRTAVDILSFQHLFHTNPTLPVSPVFPGLEELATSLVSISHIGLFPAGLIVASTAHITLAAATFYLYRRVTGRDSIAGIAAFLFALNPLHAGFDTQFIYEAPALLFGVVVLEIAVSDRPRLRVESGIALACLAGLVVTHHLTAAVIIATLAALGIATAFSTRLGLTARRLLWFCLAGVVMATAWVLGKAQPVLTYLGVPLHRVVTGILHFGDVSGTVALPATSGGGPETWLTVLGTLITASLVVSGGALLWRRAPIGSVGPLPRAFALCAFSYFGVLGVREFAPDGAEMAGRLLTFAALFTAVPMAFALVPDLTSSVPGRFMRVARPVAVAAMLGIFLGSMMSGWPAPWEQIPGTFHVGGFESGVDRQNMTAVQWFGTHVGPNKRIACDVTSCALLGAYAEAHPIPDEPSVFYAARVDRSVVGTMRHRQIAYLFVDLRMSTQKPVTGQFFQVPNGRDGAQEGPVPRASLTKFQHVPGINLIYDSGMIEIFQVQRLPNE